MNSFENEITVSGQRSIDLRKAAYSFLLIALGFIFYLLLVDSRLANFFFKSLSVTLSIYGIHLVSNDISKKTASIIILNVAIIAFALFVFSNSLIILIAWLAMWVAQPFI